MPWPRLSRFGPPLHHSVLLQANHLSQATGPTGAPIPECQPQFTEKERPSSKSREKEEEERRSLQPLPSLLSLPFLLCSLRPSAASTQRLSVLSQARADLQLSSTEKKGQEGTLRENQRERQRARNRERNSSQLSVSLEKQSKTRRRQRT